MIKNNRVIIIYIFILSFLLIAGNAWLLYKEYDNYTIAKTKYGKEMTVKVKSKVWTKGNYVSFTEIGGEYFEIKGTSALKGEKVNVIYNQDKGVMYAVDYDVMQLNLQGVVLIATLAIIPYYIYIVIRKKSFFDLESVERIE